jgi:hypothetical protein
MAAAEARDFLSALEYTSQLPPVGTSSERRRLPRLRMPFPAIIRGVDATGERFTTDAMVGNLSTCGLYLRLVRPVKTGARLFVVLRLTTTWQAPALHVAMATSVLRVDTSLDGGYGVATVFTRHRVLSPRTT